MKLKRIAAALVTLVMLLGMMPASLAEGGNIIGGGDFEVHTHSWTSWRWCEGDEGTCIRKGSQVRNCKTCSNGWEDRSAYGDHAWGSWKTTEEATCTEKGKQERKCKLCGKKKTRSIDKSAHSYGEWTIIQEAGENTTGIREAVCSVCGYEHQEDFYPEGTARKGDRGDNVSQLQQALSDAGYDCGTADGIYGNKTEAAVKQLQEEHDMNPDGIAWPDVLDALGIGKAALEAEILIEVVDVVAPVVDRLPEYTANVAAEGFSFKELRWLYNGAALADGERFKLDETYTVEVQVEGDAVDAARLKASINGEAASVQVNGGIITVSCDMVCVLPAGGMLATMDLGGRMPASVAVTIQQPRVGFYPDRHAGIVVTRVDGTTFTAGQYGGNAAEWYSQNGVNFNQPFRSTEEQYKFVNQISIPYAPDLTATVNGVSAQVESYNGGAAIQVSAWLDCLPGENVTLSVTGLDMPEEGVQPDTAVSLASEPECEVKNIRWYEINWKGTESLFYGDGAASSAFKPGCSYRVEIEVASKDGRIYPAFDHISATINGQTADKIGVRNNLIKLSYTFPKIEHAPFEISGFDVPAAGVPLDYEGTVQGPVEGAIQSVEWHKMLEKTCVPGDKAEWGGYYRLTLGIETKQPIPSDPKASINGITDGVKDKVTDGYHMEVWYEFPAVGGAYVVDVTGVTKPAIDEAADADCTIATPGFKLAKLNGMYWEVNGERVASGYAFQPGDVATVVINASLSTGTMMNPTEAAKLSATVNGESATVAVNDGKLEIRYTYPPVEGKKVTQMQILTDTITIGKLPDDSLTVSAKNEAGETVNVTVDSIEWIDASEYRYMYAGETFQPGHEYKLSGVITASDGYEFIHATKVSVNGDAVSCGVSTENPASMHFEYAIAPMTNADKIRIISHVSVSMRHPTYEKNNPDADDIMLMAYCADGTVASCSVESIEWDYVTPEVVMIGSVPDFGGVYEATITVAPGDGFLFNNATTATINGLAANLSNRNLGTQAIITGQMQKTYPGHYTYQVDSVDVQVDVPVADIVLDHSLFLSASCIPEEGKPERIPGLNLQSIEWYDLTAGSAVTSTDKAIGGHKYRMTAKIAANAGFEFISSPAVTLNGATAKFRLEGDCITVKADFGCVPTEDKNIKLVNVKIAEPSVGSKASHSAEVIATAVNGDNVSESVILHSLRWLDEADAHDMAEGEDFQENHTYRLIAEIVPAEDGYVFDSAAYGSFNSIAAAICNRTDNKMVLEQLYNVAIEFVETKPEEPNYNIVVTPDNGYINGGFVVIDPDNSTIEQPDVNTPGYPMIPVPGDTEGEEPDQSENPSSEPPKDSKPDEPEDLEPEIPVEPELPGKLEIGNLAVSKRVSSSPANGSYYVPGETVSFEVSVVNTGEVKLEGIAVSDHMMAENGGVQSYASIDPGTAEFFSFGYTISEMDAAAGSITNVASAAGFAEDGTRYADVSNAVTVPTGMKDWPMGVITELSIVKEETSSPANGAYYTEGENISYLITYTNTGETRLGETIVYDTLAGEIASAEGLDSGEDRICYFNHTVTASDVVRGYVANAAIAQYDMGGGYMGSATSNTVISDTDGDPATAPGDFGSIDWELLRFEQPDNCLRKLISHDGEGTAYEIDFCTGHQATHKAIQTMLKAAGDDVNRQRMAWEYAYGLWQKELDVMYEKLLGAADDVAKITIMSERVRYLTMVANTQFALQIANPEKGAENARVIANLWRDKCVDLCCEINTAPAGRADSFLAVPRGEPADELGETCICTVTAEDTEKSAWTDGFCFTHGFTYEMMQALLESETGAETWEIIYSLWDYELNTAYNAVYDKASGEGGIAYLTEYAAYTTWLPARLDELKLFYPEGEIPAEVMANTIMARALAICARLPQA